MRLYKTKLQEKLEESLVAVLPVVGLVLLLCFSIAPVSPGVVLEFLMGALLLIVGMMFFSLGAELSMTPMGERVGSSMAKSRKLWVMVILGFILGFVITISEPDLQVLANQVPSVPNLALILAVAGGVALFLVLALLRMLFRIKLTPMLIVFYLSVFTLAVFVPEDFLAVAFDSGGVTTGPMTVPFIMALGVGISAVRNDEHAADDSFGLVALCSVGPILAVLILGILYQPDGGAYAAAEHMEVLDSVSLGQMFTTSIPHYMMEIGMSLFPIVLFFGLFQVFLLKMERRNLVKVGIYCL